MTVLRSPIGTRASTSGTASTAARSSARRVGSGALIAARRRDTARVVAIAFGVTYGLVAIIGLIDGSDVLALIPVNSADNVLHVLLSALGIVAGLVSRARAPDRATGSRFDREGTRRSEDADVRS